MRLVNEAIHAAMGSAKGGGRHAPNTVVAPTNYVPPTLSRETCSNGDEITIGNGSYNGSPIDSFAYRHLKNGTPIVGATDQTWVASGLIIGDVITGEETATNAAGSSDPTLTSNECDFITPAGDTNPYRTNLVLELIGDDITGSDTDPVPTWEDTSGEGNDATQGTSGARPILKSSIVNGHDVVRFDGTNDRLEFPDFLSAATAATILIVARKVTNDDERGIYSLGGGFNSNHQSYSDGNIYDSFGSTVRYSWARGSNDMTGWFVWTITAATDWRARFNGASIHYEATNSIRFDGSRYLGDGGRGADYPSAMDIAEVLVYSEALSDVNREAVEDYLGTKYGIIITH